MIKGVLTPFKKGIVKTKVPLWKSSIKRKLRQNPEVLKSFDVFHEIHKKGYPGENKWFTKNLRKGLLRDITLKGKLPSKYITGSKKFQQLGIKEWMQYARTKPSKLMTGVALGAAGLAGLGTAASQLKK